MHGIPYSLQFIIPVVLLLCMYPFASIYRTFAKEKRDIIVAMSVIIIALAGFAYIKINAFKLNEYKARLDSEYNMCINWKNQMEIIKNRCWYNKNDACQLGFEDLQKQFSIRKDKISLYSDQELIGLKKLPEMHEKLQSCAVCVEQMDMQTAMRNDSKCNKVR